MGDEKQSELIESAANSARGVQHFIKGDTLFKEGTVGNRSYRILSGEVLICKQNIKKQVCPIAKLGPGELFGEMYLFHPERKRNASALAVSDKVSVSVYFEEEMEAILNQLSPALRAIFIGLTKRLQLTSEQYMQKLLAPKRQVH